MEFEGQVHAPTKKTIKDVDIDKPRQRGKNPPSESVAPPSQESKSAKTQLSLFYPNWGVVHHEALPSWLQDNDYLLASHRPPLRSCIACFLSIFRLHTETVNIWTHLLGALLFVGFAVAFFLGSSRSLDVAEKFIFFLFFLATILCMSLSWLFHTLSCHSSSVSSLFVKLDYLGIAILIVGSFVPWLYYGFYCSFLAKTVYVAAIVVQGVAVAAVSSWDIFSVARFRPLRAALFLSMGLSGIVPATHYLILEGFLTGLTVGCMGWLLLMAAIFIFGTLLYALRIPERYFPGKCDILFQSHQIFHVCVVVGCYVQYHGIFKLSEYMHQRDSCIMS